VTASNWVNQYAPGATTPTAVYRIFSDPVGSPRYVVNAANGSDVLLKVHYSAFGIPIVEGGSLDAIPFGFAGGLYDNDTGLVHFGARDYDPMIGRWVSKDPILFGGGQTNIYVYAANDPINLIDPTGLWGIGLMGQVGAEAGLGTVGAAAQGSGGVGYFSDTGLGGFLGGGGFAGPADRAGCAPASQGDPAVAAGLYAGIGAGGFWTNANSTAELKGYFSTFNVNTPIGSFQFAISGTTMFASLVFGPGAILSVSSYPTYSLAE